MSSDSPNDWQACLDDGNDWERRIKPVLKEQILNISVEQISFQDNPEKQLSGIDHVITREEPNIDVKVRDNDYYDSGDPDVLIETVSVIEREREGWLYSDGLDILAYCWKNKAGTNLRDGVLLLVNDAFVDWFEAHTGEFRQIIASSVSGEEEWHTEAWIVEVDRIPSGFIYQEFDPTLPQDAVTDQTGLETFNTGGEDA